MSTAETLKQVGEDLGVGVIFKSSDKRIDPLSTVIATGIDEGLRILQKVKTQLQMPVLTDVHEDTLDEVASVVDVMQTPAFLCRQTNFIVRVCEQGIPVNIKKGQFLAPLDMIHVAKKALSTGNKQVMVCERGASFGYNNLVSDMRSLSLMRQTQCPVVYDATHSVQMPGGQGSTSGASERWCRYWRELLWQRVLMGCLWSAIPILPRQSPMARTPGPALVGQLLQQLQAIDATVKASLRLEDQVS